MDLHVALDPRRPLAAQLFQQLREAILDGRLRAADPLPATRELAARLAVARNTVTGAYQRLVAEGYAEGRVGSGTYVAVNGARAALPRRAPPGVLRPAPRWGAPPPPAGPAPAAVRGWSCDFRLGLPDAAHFPWDEWRRLLARQVRAGNPALSGAGDPAGLAAARAAIARHAGLARGVRAGPEDVLVTTGAQQGIDLVGRLLVGPGTIVAVEDPGYPQARRSFEALGARVVPVPIDAEGLVVAALPREARLVYVTPSHQFPLGTPMSLARRLALLAWAEARGAAVLEDDYDSEFRYDGRPLEPLQRLDRAGRVVYVGTFSKVLLPMVRLGFLVAPASLLPGLVAARRVADGQGSPVAEGALARLLDGGLLARHVRRMRREYGARRARLLSALARRLGEELEPIPSAAGLHLAARFRGVGTDAEAVARRAAALGVTVEALAPYAVRPHPPGLAFGFGAVAPERIEEGVRRLACAVREERSAQRRGR